MKTGLILLLLVSVHKVPFELLPDAKLSGPFLGCPEQEGE